MSLYDINDKTGFDEFGVNHNDFSLRDEIEYNFKRAKEKEKKKTDSPWYRRTYDKVYSEANKLKNEPLYDKYKHSVVSCVGAQDGLYGATVTAAMGSTFMQAVSLARFIIHCTRSAESMAGFVLGMQHTVVKPPAAAALAPVSIVSLYSPPGSRK